MGNQPRFVPPYSLVEITTRTNGARLHLRPSPELNLRILAILGRALALYPVTLHAFVFLSNHWHALATVRDAEALASFLRYVNGNVAKAVQAINGVRGRVWQKRAEVIHILDEDAQLARLRYVLAHGTKERLVAEPGLWPGVTSARAIVGDEKLVGIWVDHEERRRLMKSGKRVPKPAEYMKRYPIELAPLPVHDGISEAARHAEIRTMLAEIVAEVQGPFLGVAAVLAQDPEQIPLRSKQGGTVPPVHTTSPVLRRQYLELRAMFRAAYREAADAHAVQPTLAAWPIDVFIRHHYVRARRSDRSAPTRPVAMLAPFQ